ncbi:unnamed protein product [Pylaiella littoralis]
MATDNREFAVETRRARGRKGSSVRTWVRRLDSSHLLVAVVTTLLVSLVAICLRIGARPGHVCQQERNTPGLRVVTCPAKTVEPGAEPQEVAEGEKQPTLALQPKANGTWENAPRIDLVCRAYSGSLKIYWDIFFPAYLTFWPIESWTTSGLVVVIDDDSEEDHRLGTILSNFRLPSKINVKYEAPPPEGTTCFNMRREGYARQQYSNFYADLYTDAEFVAVIDTDAGFITPVLPSDLFEDGKPIAKGVNAKRGHYVSEVMTRAVGGAEAVASFMTKYTFPAVFKSAHLAQMRADITSNLGAATFEEAFHMICSGGMYSQFDIMFNYLWNYKNDEYSWHLANPNNGVFRKFEGQQELASTDVAVAEKDVPAVVVMYHSGKELDTLGPSQLYDNLCVGSEYVAGNCEAEAKKRSMVGSEGEFVTAMWAPPKYSWRQTYVDHMCSVSAVASAFAWHRETDEDRIYPGT